MNTYLSSTLNQVANTWVEWMCSMAWQVTVLVPALLALTWLLRKKSARLRYALWLLVPLRLMLPPSLALVTGWGWWLLPAVQEKSEVHTAAMDISSEKNEMEKRVTSSGKENLDVRPMAIERDIATMTNIQAKDNGDKRTDTPVVKNNETQYAGVSVGKISRSLTWQAWGLCVWTLGTIGLTFWLLCGAIRTSLLIRRSSARHSELGNTSFARVEELVESCRHRIGVRTKIRVRFLDETSSPMLIGVWRPTIILPCGIERVLIADELEAVIFHELHHVARRDALVNFMQSLLGIAYFFHPLVWVANRKLNRLREDACDEATVSSLQGRRRDYGTGIVKVAGMMNGRTPRMALGVVENGGEVKHRLQRILDPRLPMGRRLSWSAIGLLLILAAVLLPSAPRRGESAPPTNAKKTTDAGKGKSETAKTETKKSEVLAIEDSVTIRGVVVDANGKPAAGVRVYVKNGNKETISNAEGKFELFLISLSGQLVRAFADGGKQQAALVLPWGGKLDEKSDLKLQLMPARRVELRVLDTQGAPIADAIAGVMSRSQYIESDTETEKTDAEGRGVFLVPQAPPVEYVFALKGGRGLDYRAYVLPRNQQGDKNAKVPQIPNVPITLTLDGVRPLRVRVLEPDGKPIHGVSLYPWLLRKPDQPEDLNLSLFSKLITITTNGAGEAVFDWIPSWNERPITVWPKSPDHVSPQLHYDPKTGDGTMTMHLDRLVPIQGRVTMPDGSPAVGASVMAEGAGVGWQSFHGNARTDADGRYVIKAAPNMIYLMTAGGSAADGKKLSSMSKTGFAVWPGKPIENLDFKLRPATRVHGRVTIGEDFKPLKDQQISVYQYGQDEFTLKEKGVELPNPTRSRFYVRPVTVHSSQTDANGNYELFVGGGEFDIRGPAQAERNVVDVVVKNGKSEPGKPKRDEPIEFKIEEEPEMEFNFHSARSETKLLRGLVVTDDDKKPVGKAAATGIYRHPSGGLDFRATTLDTGRFEVERQRFRTLMHARSSDGKLAGVVLIEPEDEEVTIPIGQMASASGRVVDKETGEPCPDLEVGYEVRVYTGEDGNSPFREMFGGKVTTDQNGRFELTSLIVGQKYIISRMFGKKVNKLFGYSGSSIGDVTPRRAEMIDVGELKIEPEFQRFSASDKTSLMFDEIDSPESRFESAKRDAARTNQRVLILFGNPKGEAVNQFLQLYHEDKVLRKTFESFSIMAVDTSGQRKAAATKLAEKNGITLDGEKLEFSAAVIAPDGKHLASADAATFMADGKISREKMAAFFAKPAVEPLDSETLIKDAISQAQEQDKRVIVLEMNTQDERSLQLSRFFQKHRELLGKDYIVVRMDQRWKNHSKIMEQVRREPKGGIPWWAILNTDGNPLVTSHAPEGYNISFPKSEGGRAHFRAMFEKTAIRLTPAEITQLVDALQKEK